MNGQRMMTWKHYASADYCWRRHKIFCFEWNTYHNVILHY